MPTIPRSDKGRPLQESDLWKAAGLLPGTWTPDDERKAKTKPKRFYKDSELWRAVPHIRSRD